MEVKKNRPRAVITGEITYHDSRSSIILEGDLEPTLFPEIRLHGTVGAPHRAENWAYRPQDRKLRSLQGEFVVQVFDRASQGLAHRGDHPSSFSIELFGAHSTAKPQPEPDRTRQQSCRCSLNSGPGMLFGNWATWLDF